MFVFILNRLGMHLVFRAFGRQFEFYIVGNFLLSFVLCFYIVSNYCYLLKLYLFSLDLINCDTR